LLTLRVLKLCLNLISYNIVFLLSGGGTLNYFGAKGFIDQELEGMGAIMNVPASGVAQAFWLF